MAEQSQSAERSRGGGWFLQGSCLKGNGGFSPAPRYAERAMPDPRLEAAPYLRPPPQVISAVRLAKPGAIVYRCAVRLNPG